MTKRILTSFLYLWILVPVQAQLNPAKARQSIVQIMVRTPGSPDPSVCTGFVWKQKDWVVTSLHAMHPNGQVQVLFNGEEWFGADVIKVHKDADLVLLKVKDAADIPANVVPLTKYNSGQIPYRTNITAIGYNRGARKSASKPLSRGESGQPENLYNTLPPDVIKMLSQFQVPNVNLDIIMLDGSLLPGYSGSPVFLDKDGSLIAVGEGGLDAGTKNVSWGIPAKYLAELEKSNSKEIPVGIESSPMHFASKVQISDKSKFKELENQVEMNPEQEFDIIADVYSGQSNGKFEFYYVKTRSFEELYNSSFDTENLDYLIMEFDSLGLHLDYSTFAFDVYEDPDNEIIIVVPSGQPLVIDNNNNFMVDLTGFPMSEWYTLSFKGEPNDGSNWNTSGEQVYNQLQSEALGQLVGGWEVNEDFTFNTGLSDTDNSGIPTNVTDLGWIFLDGQHPYFNETENLFFVSSYITLLVDPQTRFYSNAVMYMPEIANSYMDESVILDCVQNYDTDSDACDYFESWMKIVIASHLTTFSGLQYDSETGYYDE